MQGHCSNEIVQMHDFESLLIELFAHAQALFLPPQPDMSQTSVFSSRQTPFHRLALVSPIHHHMCYISINVIKHHKFIQQ